MKQRQTDSSGYVKIPFRMHPRVFAALGKDLVTNDVVAVIELVKNSYDAFADNVWIRFKKNNIDGEYIEIEDDGSGMSRSTIEDVWCLVATPNKEQNTEIEKDNKIRRVAGEKGLGRLSVARLGSRLKMLTKAKGAACLEVDVDWVDVSKGNDVSKSYVNIRNYKGTQPFTNTGTILRIYNLEDIWDENKIDDLEHNLSRLKSPFAKADEFNIYFCKPGKSDDDEIVIETARFLNEPKYSIEGKVDSKGNIHYKYAYNPVHAGKGRVDSGVYTWEQVYDNIQDRKRYSFNPNKPNCGPFKFEIRAWDVNTDGTQEISEKFHLEKSSIRKSIRAHKGISIYRDNILVLPKSENARDWLGLDLRRVSKVGTRMSTTQLVGYVSITAKSNPKIEDTSDRERLVASLETAEFEELLKAIVALLESQRDKDRERPEKPIDDLFADISAENLISDMDALVEDGAEISEALPVLRKFGDSLETTRKTIQDRFTYYSRLATVGTIAQMLVHEIRNRTTSFGRFIEIVKDRFGPFNDTSIETEILYAVRAVDALERLADTFSPLANRFFKRRKRDSVLEDQIRDCMEMQRGEIKRKRVAITMPKTSTNLSVDPGELDAILINLITNSLYWLGQAKKEEREIEFTCSIDNSKTRAKIFVHDNGPGIREEDAALVFLPGVTRKPGGIGMGLTVASELVAEYGGKMTIIYPGKKGGASFSFDLPLKI